jgi:hypothetical protein
MALTSASGARIKGTSLFDLASPHLPCWLEEASNPKLGSRVAKLLARLLASTLYSSLGSNPDISQKNKMGDISKGVANTL